MLVVPLQNGQQILVVLQSQLADIDQALLIEGAQNGPSVASHHGLLGLQDAADCDPISPICSSARYPTGFPCSYGSDSFALDVIWSSSQRLDLL